MADPLALYTQNPFRVLDRSTSTSIRELEKSSQQRVMAARLDGGSPDLEAEVQAAIHRLRDPVERLDASLFWVDLTPAEQTSWQGASALRYPWDGKAVAPIYGKFADRSVESHADHNLAVLYHAQAIELERAAASEPKLRDRLWRDAFLHWAKILKSEPFWKALEAQCSAVDDPRLTRGMVRRLRSELHGRLLEPSVAFARASLARDDLSAFRRHAGYIQGSGFEPSAVQAAIDACFDPLARRVEDICATVEAAQNQLDVEALGKPRFSERSGELLQRLADDLERDITRLRELAIESHRRVTALDQAAKIAQMIGVVAFNAGDSFEVGTKAVEIAKRWAASASLQQQVDKNIEAIREVREKLACWFCKENLREDDKAYEVGVYKITGTDRPQDPLDALRFGLGNRFSRPTGVRYSTATLRCPRCSRCAAAHASPWGCLAAAAALVAAGVWAGLLANAKNETAAVAIGVVGVALAYLVYSLLTPAGVKGEGSWTQWPIAKQAFADGYKVGKEPSDEEVSAYLSRH